MPSDCSAREVYSFEYGTWFIRKNVEFSHLVGMNGAILQLQHTHTHMSWVSGAVTSHTHTHTHTGRIHWLLIHFLIRLITYCKLLQKSKILLLCCFVLIFISRCQPIRTIFYLILIVLSPRVCLSVPVVVIDDMLDELYFFFLLSKICGILWPINGFHHQLPFHFVSLRIENMYCQITANEKTKRGMNTFIVDDHRHYALLRIINIIPKRTEMELEKYTNVTRSYRARFILCVAHFGLFPGVNGDDGGGCGGGPKDSLYSSTECSILESYHAQVYVDQIIREFICLLFWWLLIAIQQRQTR